MRLCKLCLLALASALCTAFPVTARATPQAPIAGGSREAIPPGTLAQTPPANNTPLIQPAALSGAEDKSYLSFSAQQITSLIDAYFDHKQTPQNPPWTLPTTLFSFDTQLRFGAGLTSFSNEFTYMNVLHGIELSVQDLSVANVTGPGVSLRIDLSPSRTKWVDTYKLYHASAKPFFTDSAGKALDRVQIADHVNANMAEFTKQVASPFDDFLKDFLASARALRVSAFLTHQWLDGTRYATAGFSASRVIPVHKYTPDQEKKLSNIWGIMPRIAIQAVGQDLTTAEAAQLMSPHYSRSVRTSIGLALQDNVPHLYLTEEKKKTETVDDRLLSRWQFQVGGEYLFKDATAGAESYGVYVRFRSLPAHNELSLSVSKTPSKVLMFGIGFTATWDGNRHSSRGSAAP